MTERDARAATGRREGRRVWEERVLRPALKERPERLPDFTTVSNVDTKRTPLLTTT